MAEDNGRQVGAQDDQNQGGGAPAVGEREPVNPDTGFTPTEQAAFDQMERDGSSPADVADVEHGSAPAQQAEPGAQQQQPQPGAEDDGEDDGDDEGDEAAAQGGQQQPGQAGQQGQPGQQPRRKNRVSAKKLEAAIAERDTLRQTLQQQQEMLARADERMAIINQALASPAALPGQEQQAQQQEQEDKEPNAEEAPFEWMQWSRRQLGRLESAVNSMQQGSITESKVRKLETEYLTDAQSFNQREPNFLPAYAHLMNVRTEQLALYYFGKDVTDPNAKLTQQEVQKIQAQIAAEERGYISKAVERGQSPAQYLYALAKSMRYQPMEREKLLEWYGYATGQQQQPGDQGQQQQQPGGQQPAAGAQQQQPNNGQQQRQAAPQNGNGAQRQQKPTVADEIARIRSGQEAGLSLSAGGGAPQASLSAEQLASMPQADFDQLMNRLSEREQNALLGA